MRHYLRMKPFTLSLILLLSGAASAAGQTVAAAARTANAPAPLSEKEPSLEAGAQQTQAESVHGESSRIATRPPTPLVRK